MPDINTPRVPEGLRDLMKKFAKEILREKPSDIYEYSAQYFELILKQRNDFEVKEYEPDMKLNNTFENNARKQIPMALVNTILPENLTQLIKEFIKAVIRENPKNICKFAVEYFRTLQKCIDIKSKYTKYSSYENYLSRREHFSLIPNVKCICGRIIGQTIFYGHDNEIYNKNVSFSEHTGNQNITKDFISEYHLMNERYKHYINSILLIQRFFRSCLQKKRTEMEHKFQKKIHPNEPSDLLVSNNVLSRVYRKEATAQNIEQSNFDDRASEAHSRNSSSTALMSAESIDLHSQKEIVSYEDSIAQQDVDNQSSYGNDLNDIRRNANIETSQKLENTISEISNMNLRTESERTEIRNEDANTNLINLKEGNITESNNLIVTEKLEENGTLGEQKTNDNKNRLRSDDNQSIIQISDNNALHKDLQVINPSGLIGSNTAQAIKENKDLEVNHKIVKTELQDERTNMEVPLSTNIFSVNQHSSNHNLNADLRIENQAALSANTSLPISDDQIEGENVVIGSGQKITTPISDSVLNKEDLNTTQSNTFAEIRKEETGLVGKDTEIKIDSQMSKVDVKVSSLMDATSTTSKGYQIESDDRKENDKNIIVNSMIIQDIQDIVDNAVIHEKEGTNFVEKLDKNTIEDHADDNSKDKQNNTQIKSENEVHETKESKKPSSEDLEENRSKKNQDAKASTKQYIEENNFSLEVQAESQLNEAISKASSSTDILTPSTNESQNSSKEPSKEDDFKEDHISPEATIQASQSDKIIVPHEDAHDLRERRSLENSIKRDVNGVELQAKNNTSQSHLELSNISSSTTDENKNLLINNDVEEKALTGRDTLLLPTHGESSLNEKVLPEGTKTNQKSNASKSDSVINKETSISTPMSEVVSKGVVPIADEIKRESEIDGADKKISSSKDISLSYGTDTQKLASTTDISQTTQSSELGVYSTPKLDGNAGNEYDVPMQVSNNVIYKEEPTKNSINISKVASDNIPVQEHNLDEMTRVSTVASVTESFKESQKSNDYNTKESTFKENQISVRSESLEFPINTVSGSSSDNKIELENLSISKLIDGQESTKKTPDSVIKHDEQTLTTKPDSRKEITEGQDEEEKIEKQNHEVSLEELKPLHDDVSSSELKESHKSGDNNKQKTISEQKQILDLQNPILSSQESSSSSDVKTENENGETANSVGDHKAIKSRPNEDSITSSRSVLSVQNGDSSIEKNNLNENNEEDLHIDASNPEASSFKAAQKSNNIHSEERTSKENQSSILRAASQSSESSLQPYSNLYSNESEGNENSTATNLINHQQLISPRSDSISTPTSILNDVEISVDNEINESSLDEASLSSIIHKQKSLNDNLEEHKSSKENQIFIIDSGSKNSEVRFSASNLDNTAISNAIDDQKTTMQMPDKVLMHEIPKAISQDDSQNSEGPLSISNSDNTATLNLEGFQRTAKQMPDNVLMHGNPETMLQTGSQSSEVPFTTSNLGNTAISNSIDDQKTAIQMADKILMHQMSKTITQTGSQNSEESISTLNLDLNTFSNTIDDQKTTMQMPDKVLMHEKPEAIIQTGSQNSERLLSTLNSDNKEISSLKDSQNTTKQLPDNVPMHEEPKAMLQTGSQSPQVPFTTSSSDKKAIANLIDNQKTISQMPDRISIEENREESASNQMDEEILNLTQSKTLSTNEERKSEVNQISVSQTESQNSKSPPPTYSTTVSDKRNNLQQESNQNSIAYSPSKSDDNVGNANVAIAGSMTDQKSIRPNTAINVLSENNRGDPVQESNLNESDDDVKSKLNEQNQEVSSLRVILSSDFKEIHNTNNGNSKDRTSKGDQTPILQSSYQTSDNKIQNDNVSIKTFTNEQPATTQMSDNATNREVLKSSSSEKENTTQSVSKSNVNESDGVASVIILPNLIESQKQIANTITDVTPRIDNIINREEIRKTSTASEERRSEENTKYLVKTRSQSSDAPQISSTINSDKSEQNDSATTINSLNNQKTIITASENVENKKDLTLVKGLAEATLEQSTEESNLNVNDEDIKAKGEIYLTKLDAPSPIDVSSPSNRDNQKSNNEHLKEQTSEEKEISALETHSQSHLHQSSTSNSINKIEHDNIASNTSNLHENAQLVVGQELVMKKTVNESITSPEGHQNNLETAVVTQNTLSDSRREQSAKEKFLQIDDGLSETYVVAKSDFQLDNVSKKVDNVDVDLSKNYKINSDLSQRTQLEIDGIERNKNTEIINSISDNKTADLNSVVPSNIAKTSSLLNSTNQSANTGNSPNDNINTGASKTETISEATPLEPSIENSSSTNDDVKKDIKGNYSKEILQSEKQKYSKKLETVRFSEEVLSKPTNIANDGQEEHLISKRSEDNKGYTGDFKIGNPNSQLSGNEIDSSKALKDLSIKAANSNNSENTKTTRKRNAIETNREPRIAELHLKSFKLSSHLEAIPWYDALSAQPTTTEEQKNKSDIIPNLREDETTASISELKQPETDTSSMETSNEVVANENRNLLLNEQISNIQYNKNMQNIVKPLSESERIATYMYGIPIPQNTSISLPRENKKSMAYTIPFETKSKSVKKKSNAEEEKRHHIEQNKDKDIKESDESKIELETPARLLAELNTLDYDDQHQIFNETLKSTEEMGEHNIMSTPNLSDYQQLYSTLKYIESADNGLQTIDETNESQTPDSDEMTNETIIPLEQVVSTLKEMDYNTENEEENLHDDDELDLDEYNNKEINSHADIRNGMLKNDENHSDMTIQHMTAAFIATEKEKTCFQPNLGTIWTKLEPKVVKIVVKDIEANYNSNNSKKDDILKHEQRADENHSDSFQQNLGTTSTKKDPKVKKVVSGNVQTKDNNNNLSETKEDAQSFHDTTTISKAGPKADLGNMETTDSSNNSKEDDSSGHRQSVDVDTTITQNDENRSDSIQHLTADFIAVEKEKSCFKQNLGTTSTIKEPKVTKVVSGNVQAKDNNNNLGEANEYAKSIVDNTAISKAGPKADLGNMETTDGSNNSEGDDSSEHRQSVDEDTTITQNDENRSDSIQHLTADFIAVEKENTYFKQNLGTTSTIKEPKDTKVESDNVQAKDNNNNLGEASEYTKSVDDNTKISKAGPKADLGNMEPTGGKEDDSSGHRQSLDEDTAITQNDENRSDSIQHITADFIALEKEKICFKQNLGTTSTKEETEVKKDVNGNVQVKGNNNNLGENKEDAQSFHDNTTISKTDPKFDVGNMVKPDSSNNSKEDDSSEHRQSVDEDTTITQNFIAVEKEKICFKQNLGTASTINEPKITKVVSGNVQAKDKNNNLAENNEDAKSIVDNTTISRANSKIEVGNMETTDSSNKPKGDDSSEYGQSVNEDATIKHAMHSILNNDDNYSDSLQQNLVTTSTKMGPKVIKDVEVKDNNNNLDDSGYGQSVVDNSAISKADPKIVRGNFDTKDPSNTPKKDDTSQHVESIDEVSTTTHAMQGVLKNDEDHSGRFDQNLGSTTTKMESRVREVVSKNVEAKDNNSNLVEDSGYVQSAVDNTAITKVDAEIFIAEPKNVDSSEHEPQVTKIVSENVKARANNNHLDKNYAAAQSAVENSINTKVSPEIATKGNGNNSKEDDNSDHKRSAGEDTKIEHDAHGDLKNDENRSESIQHITAAFIAVEKEKICFKQNSDTAYTKKEAKVTKFVSENVEEKGNTNNSDENNAYAQGAIDNTAITEMDHNENTPRNMETQESDDDSSEHEQRIDKETTITHIMQGVLRDDENQSENSQQNFSSTITKRDPNDSKYVKRNMEVKDSRSSSEEDYQYVEDSIITNFQPKDARITRVYIEAESDGSSGKPSLSELHQESGDSNEMIAEITQFNDLDTLLSQAPTPPTHDLFQDEQLESVEPLIIKVFKHNSAANPTVKSQRNANQLDLAIEAVIIIQRFYRKYLKRKMIVITEYTSSPNREQRQHEIVSENAAASIIQKAFRNYLKQKNSLDDSQPSDSNNSLERNYEILISDKFTRNTKNEIENNESTQVSWFVGNDPIVTTKLKNISGPPATIDSIDTNASASNDSSNACNQTLTPINSSNINLVEIVPLEASSTNFQSLQNSSELVSKVDNFNNNHTENAIQKLDKYNIPIDDKTLDISAQLIGFNGKENKGDDGKITGKINNEDDIEDMKVSNSGNLAKITMDFINFERDSGNMLSSGNPFAEHQLNANKDLILKEKSHEESNVPYERIEEPCTKKHAYLTHNKDEKESDYEPSENLSNINTDTDQDSSLEETVDDFTKKLQETDDFIKRIQKRHATEVKAKSVDEHSTRNFSEPNIQPMNELDKINSPETDEEEVVISRSLQREDTRESSGQSDSVVFGDNPTRNGSDNEVVGMEAISALKNERDHKTLQKTVTIDETVQYIRTPESKTTTSTSSLCLDDDTTESIRKKMMAFSLSEVDSDRGSSSKSIEKDSLDHDDFDISTALKDTLGTSTETESTIVSAATKIQAGTRGFLTRRRLHRASLETKSSNYDDTKASFGNDAINESLENLIKNDAAKTIQHAFRKHYPKKFTSEKATVAESRDKRNITYNPLSLESSLAARRLTLQRGNALHTSSPPQEDNANISKSKQSDSKKTTLKSDAAHARKMDYKLKWMSMRQNSMPVQIESEVLRLIPKHMRKRIKSAENEKKRKQVFKD